MVEILVPDDLSIVAIREQCQTGNQYGDDRGDLRDASDIDVAESPVSDFDVRRAGVTFIGLFPSIFM